MIQHNHPKPIIYITVYFWCCTVYGFAQMHIYLCYYTEHFSCSKYPLCFAYSSLPSSQIPGTDLFIVFIVLHFPESHTIRILQYVAFLDQLLSISSMHLRFFFLQLESSFIFSSG